MICVGCNSVCCSSATASSTRLSRNVPRDRNAVQAGEYSALRRAPYVTGVYRNVTARTFYRELIRLAETGFIKFSVQEQEPTVEIDFEAIGRY